MPINLPGELKHFEGSTTSCDNKQEVREIFFDSDKNEIRYKKASSEIIYLANENHNHGLGTSGFLPKYISPSGFSNSLVRESGAYIINNANLVLPKISGNGIMLDTTNPTYGWRDILGAIHVRPAAGGGNASLPDYVSYNGFNIYAFRFGTTNPNNHLHEAFIEYHLPHDYVPNSDIYIHSHWSQATVDTGGTAGVPGICKWMYNVLSAKGHGTPGSSSRGAFSTEVFCSGLQQGSTTQYGHMISEIQLSSLTPTSNQINSSTLEPDGLLLVRVYRDPNDTQDTLNQDVFLHFVDIHYQSTNISTKQKSPDFYT